MFEKPRQQPKKVIISELALGTAQNSAAITLNTVFFAQNVKHIQFN